MATHSSILAWKSPWMEKPGRLQSMGSLRVRHDWVTSLSLFTFMHWRRKWQPTPAFLLGEYQGQQSLVGCCLCGRTESDTTEQLNWTELNWENHQVILMQSTVSVYSTERFIVIIKSKVWHCFICLNYKRKNAYVYKFVYVHVFMQYALILSKEWDDLKE